MSANTQSFEIVKLNLEVRGEVVASNFNDFREAIAIALDGLNEDLTTDEDFGQAEQDVKSLKEVEVVITEAKAKALEQAEQLNALFSEMDAVGEQVREPRLKLEKLIKTKKAELKEQIMQQARESLKNSGISKYQAFDSRLQQVIKGKKALKSMTNALSVECSNIKHACAESDKVVDQFISEHGKDLVMDRDNLQIKGVELVEVELKRRLELKQAEDERKAEVSKRRQAEQEAAAERKKAQEAVEQSKGVPMPPSQEKPQEQEPVTVKQDSAPVKSNAITESQEWDLFKATVSEAFGILKPVKDALKHDKNIKKAQQFASAVNNTWREIA